MDSDDWVEPNMFEVLYQTAKQNDVDIVRSGAFISEWSDHSEIHPYFPIDKCNRIITNSLEIPEFVMTHVCHWASIYRHEFLNKNKINFSKSEKIVIPDFYFSFQCWIQAQSFYIIPAAFVHYRRTNPNAVQNLGKKHFLHLIKAHMETRNVMHQLKEKASCYHWSIKSLVEFQHIMADINGINELPFSFVMGCSKMFCENLQKGYITKNNLRDDFLKTYKFIAYHPVIYWLNMKLKFWCEKHQMDGKNICWRFFGLYKKIVTNQFITKYCLGIPFSKNINYEAFFYDVNNRLKILEKKLNKEGH